MKGLVNTMWGIIIAIISGAFMSIQGVFNTGVTRQTNIWLCASFVQLCALVICFGAWVLTGRESGFIELFKIDNKYMLLGGVMGAAITYTVIRSVDALGPARANMFIITSQILIAYLIELMGIFGVERVDFQWRKLIGIVVIIAGIITFKWK